MTSIEYQAKPHRSFRGTAIGIILGAAVLGGGIYYYSILRQVPQLQAAIAAVPVQLASAEVGSVPVYLDGLGTVQAFNAVTVNTRVDGELQSVLFAEGQTVKKGDLLAVVDPRPYQAALEQASAKMQQDQANLANAQYLLDKDQKLATQNITTAEQVETQKALVASLQAQLAQDQAAKDASSISLSYTELRAPIDGRTGFRLVDQGNQVHSTDTNGIVVITQTHPISVVSTLSESDLPAVQRAMRKGPVEVAALTRDGATKLASGSLTVIDNEIDQSTGTVRLKSTFSNEDEALWPGQYVDLRVLQTTLDNAVTVPSPALQRGPDGFFVYVAGDDNTAVQRPVTPGPISNGRAVIEKGLAGGERVVTFGQYRLEPGTRISQQTEPALHPPASAKKE